MWKATLGRTFGVASFCLGSAGVLSYLTRWYADALTLNASLYFHAIHPGDLLRLLDPGHSGWTKAVWAFIAAGILQASFLIWWSIALGVIARTLPARAKVIVAVLFCLLLFVGTWHTTTTTRLYNPDRFDTASRAVVPTASFRVAFVLIPFFAALARAASPVGQRQIRIYFCVVGALLMVQVHSDLALAVSAGRIATPTRGKGVSTRVVSDSRPMERRGPRACGVVAAAARGATGRQRETHGGHSDVGLVSALSPHRTVVAVAPHPSATDGDRRRSLSVTPGPSL